MRIHSTARARGLMTRPMAEGPDMAAFMAAFETYQAETRGMAAQVRQLGESVADFSQRLANINLNGQRSRHNSPDFSSFAKFVRSGERPQSSMTVGSDPDGGYMVPENIDSTIQQQLVSLSPLRNYATIVTLGAGAGVYSFNVNLRGSTSGWVGETDARPETKTPSLANITPAEGEIYASPKVSQRLLDDAAFDVPAFLQQNISDEMAVQEGAAFVNGVGTVKPLGYLTRPIDENADAARQFGTLQFIPSGGAAGFAAANPGDALLQMVYALRAPYRAGAGVAWMMNSTTASKVRQFKDGQGRYIWSDGLQAGEPSILLGFPVGIDENMPDLGANTTPIAFGNWRLGYRIVDRFGTRILRDPFTNKPNVLFYATKRVGGSTADSNAIKLLKCAVS